jgi:hypothetical protein
MKKMRTKWGKWLVGRFGFPTVHDYTEKLIARSECSIALDIGCGEFSPLSRFRPTVRTVGLDAFAGALNSARENNVHDHYVLADINKMSPEEIRTRIQKQTGARQIQLVTAFGVIEHLKKADGWRLLDICEQVSDQYVLLETPNGFVEQGAEYGNEFQRHLSGWWAHDFQGLGYTVFGTSGTRHVRGYMGETKVRLPGLLTFDLIVLSRLLNIKHSPNHAFNLVAIKDKRGVPARYSSYGDPKRR